MPPAPFYLDLAIRSVEAMDNVYRDEDGLLRTRVTVKRETVLQGLNDSLDESHDIPDEQAAEIRGQMGLPPGRRGNPSVVAPEGTTDNIGEDEAQEREVLARVVDPGLLDPRLIRPDLLNGAGQANADADQANGNADQSNDNADAHPNREDSQENNLNNNHRQTRAMPALPPAMPAPSPALPALPRVNEDLTKPSDTEELKNIINSMDKRHCLKYRWYVVRHLRRNYDPALILSRQYYYKRIVKGHEFSKTAGGWALQRLRSIPFNRIDYDATRAHLEVRESAGASVIAPAEKKRVNPERLSMILRQAPNEYGWPEVVTDATVDTVLGDSGVFDLNAFERDQGTITSPSPVADQVRRNPRRQSRIEDSDHEDEQGERDRKGTEEIQAEFQEQVRTRQDTLTAPPNPQPQARASGRRDSEHPQLRDVSRVQEPQTPPNRTKRSRSLSSDSDTSSDHESRVKERGEKRKKTKKGNESSEKEKEKERKARKRDNRRRRELEAELEELQLKFQEDLADTATKYHRKRLRVEKKLRTLSSP